MEPKTFESLEKIEKWADENQGEVTRHLIEAWKEVIETDKESLTVISCNVYQNAEDINIIVESCEAEAALDSLLEESVGREDYEAAQKIQSLQEKLE